MRAVRLPLHLGVDALWRAAGVSALLLPGAVLIVTTLHLRSIHEDSGPLGLIGAAAVLGGFALVYFAWSARASDAILEPDGIRIDGGRHGGVMLRWEEMASVRLHKGALDVAYQLDVVTKTGQTFVLADAVDEAEVASLEALHQTLRAKIGEEPELVARRADVVCCSHCGAPLTPTEQPVTTCGSCGTTNPMQATIRERVTMQRSADLTMVATSAAIERLLQQPGAVTANRSLLLAGFIAALVWIAVAIAFRMQGLQAIDAFAIGLGFFNGWAFTFAAFGFTRIALARRRALLVLSTTFGARPPARPGDAPCCRQCGAPVPVGAGVLVRCAYCEAQNVLGLDVRPLLRRVQEQSQSLEKLLQDQAAERSSWIRLGLAAVLVSAVGGFYLLVQVIVSRDFAAERTQCDQGSAEACARVGLSYSTGSVVREDKALAFHYRQMACERDHAESCRDLAFQLELGIGVERNRQEARAKYEKACRLGFSKACEERKALDQ